MHVIGIDAGGTKTVALLADEHATIVSESRGPGANLQVAGEAAVEQALGDVIDLALADRRVTLSAICVGMAGVDREDDARTVASILRRIGRASRVLVVNDALIALVAGVREEPGIVIIAGTGSIVYGRNAAGDAARAGGWGHMIGDEGSAYWIGREALAAVMRAADGRGPATKLTADILAHFDVSDISRLPGIVYDREAPRMNVVALVPIAQQAAQLGDAVAAHIFSRAAQELVLAARPVAETLDMRGEAFTFILAGGVFRTVPWLGDELGRRLIEVAPRCQVERLQTEPAVGAVWLALAEARGGARVPRYRS